ncbi:cytochrome P450 [Nocardiopsis sp. MG754419]|uniref:cytochrome P450 n=1 Tax=Nocardiopsis sp. MG754419 TaxID=2259865 RepID=UPI001BAC6C51|nr:cytochrome P450 [Nocardiopsis sp. MG754419]MBR8743940.1 cytochrome P450 [Nocardiopsis sp. MG754419]
MTTIRPDGEHEVSAPAQGCPADVTRLYGGAPTGGRDDLWNRLRERYGPVAPVELEPGVMAWALLDYKENLSALQQTHLFTRDTRRWREVVEGRVDLARSHPLMAWQPNALFIDGAEHTRLRSFIADALARVDLAAMSRTVRRIADDLIDVFVARGEADLIGEFANLLPTMVINRLFGLPDGYGYMLGDLTAVVFDGSGGGEEAIARLQQYFAGVVERKVGDPGSDLVSWMLAHPSKPTPHEVGHQAALLISGSHMPTTHLVGNTMRTLLCDDRIRSAHADARLSTPDLLDHVMWTDTPFQLLAGRIALQDVRIGGTMIRTGDAVFIGIEAAHRDPAVQRGANDPDTGLASGSRAHLMFGAGPHSCPAREPARLVASTGVSALQDRLGGLRLAVAPEELRPIDSPFLRGLETLPVSFTPGRPAEPVSARTRQMEQVPAVAEEEEPPEDLLGRLFRWWRGRG